MVDTAGLALFPLPVAVPGWAVHLLRPRPLREDPEIASFGDRGLGAHAES